MVILCHDRSQNACYWRTANGAELDLLVRRAGFEDKLLGFEVKRTSSPKVSSSMRIVISDLQLDRIDVIHAGDNTFDLDHNIRAVAASRMLNDL